VKKRTRAYNILLLAMALAATSFPHVRGYADESSVPTGFVVVINAGNKKPVFSKQQIRHIFMGGALSRVYTAINLPSGHPLRVQFNTKVIGLTESRIQSYWAQMKFTGRSAPPEEVANTAAIMELLLRREGTVAYMPDDISLPGELTVIYP